MFGFSFVLGILNLFRFWIKIIYLCSLVIYNRHFLLIFPIKLSMKKDLPESCAKYHQMCYELTLWSFSWLCLHPFLFEKESIMLYIAQSGNFDSALKNSSVGITPFFVHGLVADCEHSISPGCNPVWTNAIWQRIEHWPTGCLCIVCSGLVWVTEKI